MHGDDRCQRRQGGELGRALTEPVHRVAYEGETDELTDFGRLSEESLGSGAASTRVNCKPSNIEQWNE